MNFYKEANDIILGAKTYQITGSFEFFEGNYDIFYSKNLIKPIIDRLFIVLFKDEGEGIGKVRHADFSNNSIQ